MFYYRTKSQASGLNVFPVCDHCALAISKECWEGWEYVGASHDADCQVCGTNRVLLRAEASVKLYRSELPGEGQDWDTDWWVGAWESDYPNSEVDFSDYLEACKKAWRGIR